METTQKTEREQFSFIGDDDWEENINDKDFLKKLNEQQGKKKFLKMCDQYSLKVNSNLTLQKRYQELRIVLIGKTGVGKSATGNTILGGKYFKSAATSKSVTKKAICNEAMFEGCLVRVMDTPGLHDTSQSEEVILREISRVTKVFPEGVHAFLYIQNIASTRFTKEEITALATIENRFGGQMKTFRILVLTNAETQLHHKKTLDEFKVMQSLEGEDNFKRFIEELGCNIVAINNETTVPAEKERNQRAIITLVESLVNNNQGAVYTSKYFAKAAEEWKRLKTEAVRKQWPPDLLKIVDRLIAADPDIVDREGEIGEKVMKLRFDERERKLEENLQQERRQMEEDFEKWKMTEGETIRQQAEEAAKEHQNLLETIISFIKQFFS